MLPAARYVNHSPLDRVEVEMLFGRAVVIVSSAVSPSVVTSTSKGPPAGRNLVGRFLARMAIAFARLRAEQAESVDSAIIKLCVRVK